MGCKSPTSDMAVLAGGTLQSAGSLATLLLSNDEEYFDKSGKAAEDNDIGTTGINSIATITTIEELSIGGDQSVDISNLSSLDLAGLEIDGFEITNGLTVISNMTNLEWLGLLEDRNLLSKLAHALYDLEKYEDALIVFKKAYGKMQEIENEEMAKAFTAFNLIWQGHVLDLLGKREEAISVYQKVVDMNLTHSRASDGRYGLRYKPTLSGYAAERIKKPFKRLENIFKD